MRNLAFILFLLVGLHLGAQYYPSKGTWEEKTPTELSLNESQIQNAIQFAIDNEYDGPRDLRLAILEAFKREPFHKIQGPTKERGGPAGLIIKDGFIIGQWGDIDRVDMTFSVTKSYLSTTVGLAFDDGLIESIDDKVAEYIWDSTFEGEHNSNITWKHLLQQNSDWSGTHFGLYDWADRPPREQTIDQWRARELNEPGALFKYNDVRVNVLSYSAMQVWRRPLPQVIKERIMDPIGASDTWRWFGYDDSWTVVDGLRMQSVSGGGHHGGGIFISARDHGKFGLLFCRNGNWAEKQLISKKWIDMIQIPSEPMESYGYMWWLNRGERKWKNVPDHVFYAAGFGGNFIVVDQEIDLVIVTRWLEPSEIGEMVKFVYAAID